MDTKISAALGLLLGVSAAAALAAGPRALQGQ